MVFQTQRLERIWGHARGFYNCRGLYGYPLQAANSDSECVIPAGPCLDPRKLILESVQMSIKTSCQAEYVVDEEQAEILRGHQQQKLAPRIAFSRKRTVQSHSVSTESARKTKELNDFAKNPNFCRGAADHLTAVAGVFQRNWT